MAKQEILEILSCDDSAGEGAATLDSATGEMTGSGSEAGEVVKISSASAKDVNKVTQSTKKHPASGPVLMKETPETSGGEAESREKEIGIPIDDTESENESSSSGDEESEEQTEASGELSNKVGNTRVAGAGEVGITKRKREEEDQDGSGSTGGESDESDASAGSPCLKKKRESTAEEEAVPELTPPPTPRKSKAKKDVKRSGRIDGVADVGDTGLSEGRARGGPQPKPKRGGKKKEASTIVVKSSSSSHTKPKLSTKRKTIKKDPKAPVRGGVASKGQKESVEGSITVGEIGIIFETLTAEADWTAVVAKMNALVGLKRLGRSVSRHWKTVAKKRLLDAYGA